MYGTLKRFQFFVSLILILNLTQLTLATEPVRLINDSWSICLCPDSLRLEVQPASGNRITAFGGHKEASKVVNLRLNEKAASWDMPENDVHVSVSLKNKELSVNFVADNLGTFTLPVFEQSEDIGGIIWPCAEGQYIPLDNKRWKKRLVEQSPWNTIEMLSMPFWGLDCGKSSLTFILTNPYNNEISFSEDSHKIKAIFSHEITPFTGSNSFGIVIRLGDNSSPVEPALQFRQWLISRGQFVSMQDKIRKVPKAARLEGAAHVYLWGDAPLSRHDIPQNKWRIFCKKLVEEAQQDGPSPGKRIKQLMTSEHWSQVVEICTMELPYNYIKGEVINELSRLLGLKEFYDKDAWQNIELPLEAVELLGKGRNSLSVAELCRMNSLILYSAYRPFMLKPEDWGDGVSLKMLRQFRNNGFDRLRLCVAGWEGIEKRPHVADEADEMGYLFGTYDSFHSIHNPKYAGTDSSWPTAQFDQELFDTGGIVNKEGRKRGGFRKVGYKLSPVAARPYVEKRVKENMSRVPYSYYFIDCDATGEVFDDYSPSHRAGQADDAQERIDRLRWISETYGVPVGSEGGNSFAAGVIHVAEGIFGPLVAWGDSDMNDKNSKYYKGGYYPPDGPKVFVMQVPLKPEYEYFYYDPRFRLPLYETVFHDSVVTTHWWGNGSFKFTTVAETVELTELLYMVAPMYHLNLDEFKKLKTRLKKHYEFFSPLHREVGLSRMTSFDWLTKNHLVQKTVFDDKAEVIANFSQKSFQYNNTAVAPRSILVVWKKNGKTQPYSPVPIQAK